MAVFDDKQCIHRLNPDFRALSSFPYRGIIATAPSNHGEYDFISRFFAPAAGVDEDPVTGSAHCTLACYWSERLGKRELRAHQASARGGRLLVRLEGKRVYLTGQAVTVLKGELFA